MARGWESKSVESQIEESQTKRRSGKPQLTAEETVRLREREGLQLHRTRVLNDIEVARNPRYQEVLKAALAHLDERLALFE